jgi:signal transduction histidine kinase
MPSKNKTMNPPFFKSLSLQRRFIIITFTSVIVFMVIMGIMITRRETGIMYRDKERQGRILAETLAIPVMNDLIYEKLGLVEEGGLIDNYVTEIFGSKDIDLLYITVLDVDGRVISHNDFNEYDKVYDDPITVKALASDSTVAQKFYADKIGHEAIDFATPLSIGKKRWGTLKFAVSLESLHYEVQTVILHVIIITLVLLIVSFVAIILLSRRFIRPITELALTMEKAGIDKLDVKADIKGSDEIVLLGQSFNRMIERIRESNLELKQTHSELLKFVRSIERTGVDVLDMKVDIEGCEEITLLCHSFNRMIDRIRESNLELKKTHEKLFQSQKLASIGILASGVAHEINNPLGGMFNCVQMLEQKGEDKDFRQRYLKLIKDGLGRIETTVGKLLWMYRKKEKIPCSVDVKQSLKDVYRFIEYRLKQNNITFSENVEDGVSIVIDPYDLQLVTINLLINAIQTMKNGGTISVNAFYEDSRVAFEVSDTGEGIEEENVTKIYDPFYTTKQPGEGTGLGLWVVYEIVEYYNADISVNSKKGEGSTFTIKFDRE